MTVPVKLIVNGVKIEIDTDDLLIISDVNTDMSQVSAQMAYYSSIHAAAEEERVQMDTVYRKWRAHTGLKILEKDPKAAEWKVRQMVEAEPQFEKLKYALARAVHNTTLTRGIYESLKIKAQMLQSKGAMLRAELDSTGMTTPEKSSKRTADKETSDERLRKMRLANSSKKKKSKS